MSQVLLLDGNSLLYRGFFAMRALNTTAGLPTNALYSLTLMTLATLDRFKPDAVVCTFDAPVATFRHLELESYKGTRQSPPDELKAQSPIARDLVKAFGFQLIEMGGYEADDVIGTLAERAKAMGHAVYIVTGDLDAVQLVDDEHGPVKVVTTIRGVTETVIYDEEAVKNRYGLTPAQIPDFKGLKGDTSDNLPGIPGIGDKTATKLLQEYGTVDNLVASLPTMADQKLKAKIEPYAAQAEQCKRLATIIRDVPLPEFEFQLDYQERGADIDSLKILFDQLEFRTLLKRFTGEGKASASGSGAPRQTARNYGADTALQTAMALAEPDDAVAASATEPVAKETIAEAEGIVLDTELPDSYEGDSPYAQAAAEISAAGEGSLGLSALPAVLLITQEAPEKADVMTATPLGLAIAEVSGEPSRFVAWDEIGEAERTLLADAAVPKITHNAKLMIGVLGRLGVEVRGIAFDTMLAAYLINSARSGYPLLGIIADFVGRDVAADDYPALADSLRALEPVLRARLRQDKLESLHDDMELPLAGIIAKLERAGVTIDPQWLGRLGVEMGDKVKELENEVYNLAGEKFGIGSTKQLQQILFEKMGLPPGKKTKTGYSTDADVLEALAEAGHEIAAKVIQWREVNKLKSTYVDALPALVSPLDGKVHTTLSQTVASTGRLSSSNPNLQNIPVRTEIGREIRKAFIAEPGCVLVSADYSQIELRIFAYITEDPELVRTFAADEDIHRRTASLIFDLPEAEVTSEQRRYAKTVNFAVIYGMSSFRLATEIGVTQVLAAEWRKKYFENYPGVKAFAKQTLEEGRQFGYVQTLLGRRRYVPDITSRVFAFRQAAEREAVNMPVQGTSADIIKLAMIRVDKALRDEGFQGSMVLQVHDELLFECPQEEAERLATMVRREMEAAYKLGDIRVRADAKQGHNWSEMTPAG